MNCDPKCELVELSQSLLAFDRFCCGLAGLVPLTLSARTFEFFSCFVVVFSLLSCDAEVFVPSSGSHRGHVLAALVWRGQGC